MYTDAGDELRSRFYVMATGCLSVPKDIDIEGIDDFAGPTYVTGRWPHEGVDFTGQRVAVIGTGSSGVQSIPIIASQADELVVFQRTPNFSLPAWNGPAPAEKLAELHADPDAFREANRWSGIGVAVKEPPTEGVFGVDETERLRRFEEIWAEGELRSPGRRFNDLQLNPVANRAFAEFIHSKIHEIVDDPETAALLCPQDHPVGSKRMCLDSGYYETYNQPHVRLVDIRSNPIQRVTSTGIEFGDEAIDFDAVVFATGFDAMTGALVAVDIEGRDGITLKDKWVDGPVSYLGLTSVGFPNLFMITGPGSPSVLSNMVVSIEQHVDFIADCVAAMRDAGHDRIEPTEDAEAGWVQHGADCASITLFPSANSWYMGANVPGKPRVFLPYVGGVGTYRGTCNDVVDQGYLGFAFDGPGGPQRNDGRINELQLDVMLLLNAMAEMDLPPFESMPPADARAMSEAMNAARPTGPDVGEIVDGTYPGADGDLDYRLYRPDTTGPHPIVVYFHGGGWVLGSATSDDGFCRELCAATNAIVISCDYRHGPEARFPAAPDDAYAAVQWVAANAVDLGGRAGELAVAGWSAGANLAAVVSQRSRDDNGPAIAGQLLVTPVTDGASEWPSMSDNADGYVLTRSLMDWFWGHYCDEADRADPAASPLRAASLASLPPAAVFTAQFDPLRDEGNAYATALADAGVPVHHHEARGHVHTSLTGVGMFLSSIPIRREMADAVRGFFA